VALEFLYDENNEEYCFEEVLARSRKILEVTYPKPNGATMTMPLKGGKYYKNLDIHDSNFYFRFTAKTSTVPDHDYAYKSCN
jgi:hypothetical protein